MSYLVGWLVAGSAIYVTARRTADRRSPAPHPFLISVVAGAAWPLLVLGLVEMSSLVLAAKVLAHFRHSTGMPA